MGKLLKTFSILGFYFLIAVFFTYPLILNLKDSFVGFGVDGFLYPWNIDSFWHEISLGRNPFFTKQILYPLGVNLIFHTYAPLVSIFGFFFRNNLVLYLNILIIGSIVFSSYATFQLSKYLTKQVVPSFISGVIYGISPIMLSFIVSRHYYFVIAAPFLPLSILYLFRFLDKKSYRHLILIFIIFWLCFFTDYYTTVLLILTLFLITLFYFITFFPQKKGLQFFFSKQNLYKTVLYTTLFLIIPGIFVFLFLFNKTDFSVWQKKASFFPSLCSTTAKGFFIPSSTNPFLGKISTVLSQKFTYPINFDTPSYFLGWGLFVFAVFSIIKNIRNKYILTLLPTAVFIFLLSLGPKTPLFSLFTKIPFLNLIDCPLRFPIAIELFLAISIGIGIASAKKPKKLLLALVFIFIITIEYTHLGNTLTRFEVPEVYKIMATYKDNKTILELPSGLAESKGGFGLDWSIYDLHSRQMYWQTIHNKPRVGGYISRIPPSSFEYFKKEPIVSDLFSLTSPGGIWTEKKYKYEEVRAFINKFNLGYIIVSPNPRQETILKAVDEIFEKNLIEEIKKEGWILYLLK